MRAIQSKLSLALRLKSFSHQKSISFQLNLTENIFHIPNIQILFPISRHIGIVGDFKNIPFSCAHRFTHQFRYWLIKIASLLEPNQIMCAFVCRKVTKWICSNGSRRLCKMSAECVIETSVNYIDNFRHSEHFPLFSLCYTHSECRYGLRLESVLIGET